MVWWVLVDGRRSIFNVWWILRIVAVGCLGFQGIESPGIRFFGCQIIGMVWYGVVTALSHRPSKKLLSASTAVEKSQKPKTIENSSTPGFFCIIASYCFTLLSLRLWSFHARLLACLDAAVAFYGEVMLLVSGGPDIDVDVCAEKLEASFSFSATSSRDEQVTTGT